MDLLESIRALLHCSHCLCIDIGTLQRIDLLDVRHTIISSVKSRDELPHLALKSPLLSTQSFQLQFMNLLSLQGGRRSYYHRKEPNEIVASVMLIITQK
jgi:hypothetical protein